jgi:hypothetical protein
MQYTLKALTYISYAIIMILSHCFTLSKKITFLSLLEATPIMITDIVIIW